jgi:hypothetical protein
LHLGAVDVRQGQEKEIIRILVPVAINRCIYNRRSASLHVNFTFFLGENKPEISENEKWAGTVTYPYIAKKIKGRHKACPYGKKWAGIKPAPTENKQAGKDV